MKNHDKIHTLNRVFAQYPISIGQSIELPQEQAHYLTNVLRLKLGFDFRIFNDTDGEYLAKIIEIKKKSCVIHIHILLKSPIILPYLCAAISIIKNDNMALCINALTQIGVTDFVPLIAQRTQKRDFNYDRMRKIMAEATEQSERFDLPKLHDAVTLATFLQESDTDMTFYANENETQNTLLSYPITGSIAVVIGPEGGFSDEELEILAQCNNTYSVSLGSLILRAEIAAIALT